MLNKPVSQVELIKKYGKCSEEGEEPLVTAEADDEKSAQQVDEDRTEDQVRSLRTHWLSLRENSRLLALTGTGLKTQD